jgi:hypothetical protein
MKYPSGDLKKIGVARASRSVSQGDIQLSPGRVDSCRGSPEKEICSMEIRFEDIVPPVLVEADGGRGRGVR